MGAYTPSTINPQVLLPSTGVSLATINSTISSAQQKSKTGAKVPGLTSAPSSGDLLQSALPQSWEISTSCQVGCHRCDPRAQLPRLHAQKTCLCAP